jgi:hypothetical protein
MLMGKMDKEMKLTKILSLPFDNLYFPLKGKYNAIFKEKTEMKPFE